MTTEPDALATQQAIARIKSRRAFVVSLFVYVLINAGLVIVWAFTRDNHAGFWPIWTIFFWGLGLALQGWRAFGGGRRPITEAEVQHEIERGGESEH